MKIGDLSADYVGEIVRSQLNAAQQGEVLIALSQFPGFLDKVNVNKVEVKDKSLLANMILACARDALNSKPRN